MLFRIYFGSDEFRMIIVECSIIELHTGLCKDRLILVSLFVLEGVYAGQHRGPDNGIRIVENNVTQSREESVLIGQKFRESTSLSSPSASPS